MTGSLSLDSFFSMKFKLTLKHVLLTYWPFVRGIHQSSVKSPHKGQWRVPLMFYLICAWINGWVNNCEAGNLRGHCAHYDVIVMYICTYVSQSVVIFQIVIYSRPGVPISISGAISYQYKDSHYKDKMSPCLSHRYNGNYHTWTDGLYIACYFDSFSV